MSGRVKKLMKIIGKESSKTNSELSKMLGVSVATVDRYLRKLKNEGVIECSTKRYRQYIGASSFWRVYRTIRSSVGISES